MRVERRVKRVGEGVEGRRSARGVAGARDVGSVQRRLQ